MTVSFEFYAGDPEQIGRAFSAIEFDALRDGSLAHDYADLSLHLSLEHLDMLSDAISSIAKRPVVHLLDSLERTIGGFEGEGSADVVSSSWVAFVASVPTDAIPTVARRWLEAVAVDCGDPNIKPTPDAEGALGALVSLCRHADMLLRRLGASVGVPHHPCLQSVQERFSRVVLGPRLVTAAGEAHVLELRHPPPKKGMGSRTWMRIVVAVEHDHRCVDGRECCRLDPLALEAPTVLPGLLVAPFVHLDAGLGGIRDGVEGHRRHVHGAHLRPKLIALVGVHFRIEPPLEFV
jgi:hypothetical protein